MKLCNYIKGTFIVGFILILHATGYALKKKPNILYIMADDLGKE